MTSAAPDALVIVYNADEGLGAALFDAVHKLVRPDTYPCDLCAITYGAVSMRGAWRDWLKAQPFAAEFYHRQDFHRAFPAFETLQLPAILRRDGMTLTSLLGPDDMQADMPVSALIAAVDAALNPVSSDPAVPPAAQRMLSTSRAIATR